MILNINQMLPAEMYLYLFIRPRRDLQHRGYYGHVSNGEH